MIGIVSRSIQYEGLFNNWNPHFPSKKWLSKNIGKPETSMKRWV